jgi:hypothetical protein
MEKNLIWFQKKDKERKEEKVTLELNFYFKRQLKVNC